MDQERLEQLIRCWPYDIRDHLWRMAQEATQLEHADDEPEARPVDA